MLHGGRQRLGRVGGLDCGGLRGLGAGRAVLRARRAPHAGGGQGGAHSAGRGCRVGWAGLQLQLQGAWHYGMC